MERWQTDGQTTKIPMSRPFLGMQSKTIQQKWIIHDTDSLLGTKLQKY